MHARIPPQNIDAERAVLGALLIKPDALHDVADVLAEGDFYVEKHRIIFRAVLALFGKGEPIDLISTSAKLKDAGELERIGGASYLSELATNVPAAASVPHYAGLVHKSALLRRLIEAGDFISELGYETAGDVDETLDKAEKRIYEVTEAPSLHKFVPMRSLVLDSFAQYEELSKSTGEIRGVPSGFRSLDAILSGFQPADLIILAARPSVGKTAFALDIARQTAIHHQTPVGVFSLEMSSQQLVDRMLAAEARVDGWKLRTGGRLSEYEYESLHAALERLSDAPIYIDDQPANNILGMRSVARRLKREHGLGLLIIDYLQLMAPTHTRSSDSMVQQVTEISRSLKQLARELSVPILALSQLSRAVEQRGGKPRLSDLRDSGSIEQDADVVMFIHRDDKSNKESERPGIAEILVEKHRNGPVGMVELYFDEKKASYLSIEKSDFSAFEEVAAGEGQDEF
ncbi:replicative DNA helicase [Patescibacteria group bacterium]|jgi:replicative DNA helicase|nr:replicative DNA helicase [Patescibacteria group bacterium]